MFTTPSAWTVLHSWDVRTLLGRSRESVAVFGAVADGADALSRPARAILECGFSNPLSVAPYRRRGGVYLRHVFLPSSLDADEAKPLSRTRTKSAVPPWRGKYARVRPCCRGQSRDHAVWLSWPTAWPLLFSCGVWLSCCWSGRALASGVLGCVADGLCVTGSRCATCLPRHRRGPSSILGMCAPCWGDRATPSLGKCALYWGD